MKASERKLIESVWHSIPEVFDGFWEIKRRIYNAALAGERQHRKGAPAGYRYTMPAKTAAKYFACKWLAEYASGRAKLPELREINHLCDDARLSAGYVAEFPEKFGDWAKTVPAEFWLLDYCKMVQS